MTPTPYRATSAALALLLLPALAGAQMFRGAADHRGVYESPRPTLATVAWRFRTKAKVLSSPAVSDSTVFIGSSDGNVYALNAANGELRWKYPTKGAITSSPAHAAGAVLVTSADGKLYALNAADGTLRWSFATKGERRFTAPGIHGIQPATEMMPDPYDVFISSPAVANGVVFFGSGDNNVYAIDLTTGAQRWMFATGNVVHASPAVAGGVVYIGSWDRNMYALDAATGKERWRYQTGDDTVEYNQVGIASSAAVVDGGVYFGCRDGHFYALDAATGKLRWSHDNKGGWVIASPVVEKGIVYFPTSDGTRFKAIDARTGALKFDVQNKAVSFSSPAFVNGALYYGTSDGWLHAIEASTGAVIADFQTDGSRANAEKYINADGRINMSAVYEARTLDAAFIGQQRVYTLGSILSSPAVARGMLFVGSADGTVYALR